MKSAGILCECDPCHKGHEYLIKTAKENGADVVVCLLSGAFTERGDAAFFDPRTRAEALLCAGADLVLEFPFPYSAAGAEFFAAAAVDCFSRLGVDEMWFGSESGDLAALSRLAKAANDPEFLNDYAAANESGSADAYFSLLAKHAGYNGNILPNDILAIQYLAAIAKSGAPITPHAVRRLGDMHDSLTLTGNGFPSASALRQAIAKGTLSGLSLHLPSGSLPILQRALDEGLAPADLSRAETFLLGRLRTLKKEEIATVAGLSGGLGERLAAAAKEATTLAELTQKVATKKFTDARIRRSILFAAIGVTDDDLRAPVAYLRLLAADERGRTLLALLRKKNGLPIVTKQRELPQGPSRRRELEEAAYALYTLALSSPRGLSYFFTLPPIVEK